MSKEFLILIIQEISWNQPHERNLIRYKTSSNHLKSSLETHVATEIPRHSSLLLSKKSRFAMKPVQTISNKVKRSISTTNPYRFWRRVITLVKKRFNSFFKSSQIRSNDSQRDKNSQIFKNLQFQQRINIERRPNRREERVDEQVKRGGIATDSWTASTGRGWSLKDPSDHLSFFFSSLSRSFAVRRRQ